MPRYYSRDSDLIKIIGHAWALRFLTPPLLPPGDSNEYQRIEKHQSTALFLKTSGHIHHTEVILLHWTF